MSLVADHIISSFLPILSSLKNSPAFRKVFLLSAVWFVVAIAVLGQIRANFTPTDVTCYGANNGTISITNETGGTEPYQYSNDGGTTWQPSPLFENLLPGSYEIWIADAFNSNFLFEVEINQPPLLTGSASVTSPIICNGRSATITIDAQGGTTPLIYEFNGTQNITGIFTDIHAGVAFNWSITDENGCGPVTGALDVTEPAALAITSGPLGQTDCYGNTVSFSVEISGAVGAPLYQWQSRPPGGSFSDIVGGTSSTLSIYDIGVNGLNIHGTEYQVLVTDACGTISSPSALLQINSITDLTPDVTHSEICHNGSISYEVFTQGEVIENGYQWSWNDGSGWQLLTNGSVYNGVRTNRLEIINATSAQNGEYRVSVTFRTLNQPSERDTCVRTDPSAGRHGSYIHL